MSGRLNRNITPKGIPSNEIFDLSGDLLIPDDEFVEAVKEHVQRMMMSEDLELPRVSSVAEHIMRIARDPHVDVDKVVSLIQADPVLAGKVLSLINSAYFSVRQEVISLRHAIVLLGTKVVGDLVFCASMKLKVFRCPEYEPLMVALWHHSVATAVATEILVERNGNCEFGFMAGLLHDIGKTTLLSAIVATEEAQRSGEPIGEDSARAVMEELSLHVGGLLARKWNLSEEVVQAIIAHDQFSEELPLLVSCVHCANKIVHHLGLGCEQIEVVPSLDPGLRALNLGTLEEFTEVAEAVAQRTERIVDTV